MLISLNQAKDGKALDIGGELDRYLSRAHGFGWQGAKAAAELESGAGWGPAA